MQKPIKHIAKETMFVIASLACMVVIIILTSISNAGLDPNNIFSAENISNMVVAAAITIFGTISAVPAGTVSTKQRLNKDGSPGRYIQEFNEYQTVRKLIEDKRAAFNQWHNLQHLKECRQKALNYLLERGITQADTILELNVSDVDKLTTAQCFTINDKTVYVKALTPEQIAACRYALSGKVRVHKLPDFYFLYVDGKSTTSFYDQAYYEAKSESRLFASKLLYKLFIGFAISCVFAGLVFLPVDESMSTKEVALKALLLTFSRIFNAVSSVLWGWLLGQDVAYTQCYYINGRTQFLKLFHEDRSFVALSDQEYAKAEFERSLQCQTPQKANLSSGSDSPGGSE